MPHDRHALMAADRWLTPVGALSGMQVRSVGRRARSSIEANPLIGSIVALLAVGAPVGLWVLGSKASLVATEMLRASPELFLANLVVLAVLIGASLASSAPGLDSIDPLLAASGLSRWQRLSGWTLLPILAVLLALGCAVVLSCHPIFLAATGGHGTTALVLVLGLVVASTAAIAFELILRAVRLSMTALAGLLPLIAVWFLTGWGHPLGPLNALSAGLTGQSGSGLTAWIAPPMEAMLGVSVWVLLLDRRPPAVTSGTVGTYCRLPIFRSPSLALVVMFVHQLARAKELQRHFLAVLTATVAFVGLGLFVLDQSPIEALQAPALLASMGAATFALATRDVAERGMGWWWATVPVSNRMRAVTTTLAGVALSMAAVAVTIVPLLLAAGADLEMFATMLSMGFVVVGAASLAGAVLPWCLGRLAEQAASYAVLTVVIAATFWLQPRVSVSWLGQHLGPQGVSTTVGLALVATAVVTTRVLISGHERETAPSADMKEQYA